MNLKDLFDPVPVRMAKEIAKQMEKKAEADRKIVKIEVVDDILTTGFVNEASNPIEYEVTVQYGASSEEEKTILNEAKTSLEATAGKGKLLELTGKYEEKEETKTRLKSTETFQKTTTTKVTLQPGSGYVVHQVVYHVTVHYASGRVTLATIKSQKWTVKNHF